MKQTLLLSVLLATGGLVSAQALDPWTNYMTPSDVHPILNNLIETGRRR